jgi:hypothetical protein
LLQAYSQKALYSPAPGRISEYSTARGIYIVHSYGREAYPLKAINADADEVRCNGVIGERPIPFDSGGAVLIDDHVAVALPSPTEKRRLCTAHTPPDGPDFLLVKTTVNIGKAHAGE